VTLALPWLQSSTGSLRVVDILLLLMIVGAGVLGWRRGLAVSLVAGCVFFLAGLPFAALAAAVGMPPAAGFLLGGLLGLVPVALRLEVISEQVEGLLGSHGMQVADRAGGALLNVLVAACLGWFIAAIATVAPGDTPALAAMRSSAVFGSLVDAVPPQGTLGVLVLRSGLVPALNGPLVLAEEPDPASAITPAVLTARGSVLQVRSTACDSIVTGTGWVAGNGIVVTNAHVVAGAQRSFLAGGPRFEGVPATVTAFDPINDIAVLVLDAGALGRLPPPLPIVSRVRHGEPAAVIGFPRGGEQSAGAARIDRVAPYDVEPLGGGAPVSAQILAIRAEVQPGNSGGPIVAEDGSVLGLVVSKALGQRQDAAYGVPSSELLRVIADGSDRTAVSTGRCLEDAELTTEPVVEPAPDAAPGTVPVPLPGPIE
jgi:S1-C subfamily serine protease